MKEYSKLPWKIEDRFSICSENRFIASTGGYISSKENNSPAINQANAVYIIQACNAFPLMVEALEDALRLVDGCVTMIGGCSACDDSVGYVCEFCNEKNAILDDIRSALSAAKGEADLRKYFAGECSECGMVTGVALGPESNQYNTEQVEAECFFCNVLVHLQKCLRNIISQSLRMMKGIPNANT